MDIRDSQRIKQICDNTEKMADAFVRIADALERLTEPKDEPKTKCDTCKTYWNCQGQCDEMPQIEDELQTEETDCIPFDPLVEMDIKRMIEVRLAQTKGMSNEDR